MNTTSSALSFGITLAVELTRLVSGKLARFKPGKVPLGYINPRSDEMQGD